MITTNQKGDLESSEFQSSEHYPSGIPSDWQDTWDVFMGVLRLKNKNVKGKRLFVEAV